MGQVYNVKYVKGTRVYEQKTEEENEKQRKVIQEIIKRQKDFYDKLTQK